MSLRTRLTHYVQVLRQLRAISVMRPKYPAVTYIALVMETTQNHTERPLLCLLNVFAAVDKIVYVRARLNRVTYGLASHSPFHKNLRLLWQMRLRHQQTLLITDHLPPKNNFIKIVQLKYDYSPVLKLPDSTHIAMPFTMHSHTYFYAPSPIPLDRYRRSDRKYQVLFAGNSTPSYATTAIVEDCKILDRHTIISHLTQHKLFYALHSDNTQWYPTLADVPIPQDARYVLLVSVRIWQKNWLQTLAASSFALCPSGVVFPLSHNLIEAMAVGTIPILNYADWLFPALQDGINCIVFKTLAQLDEKIEAIAHMSDAQIAEMRQAVIDYYDCYLDPAKFAARLIGTDEKFLTVHMLDEHAGYVRQLNMQQDT